MPRNVKRREELWGGGGIGEGDSCDLMVIQIGKMDFGIDLTMSLLISFVNVLF